MQETSIDVIIKSAQEYAEAGTRWHHHFLALDCQYNAVEKYQIVLENEETKESFVCYFDDKPIDELEELESIFFNRNH